MLETGSRSVQKAEGKFGEEDVQCKSIQLAFFKERIYSSWDGKLRQNEIWFSAHFPILQ